MWVIEQMEYGVYYPLIILSASHSLARASSLIARTSLGLAQPPDTERVLTASLLDE